MKYSAGRSNKVSLKKGEIPGVTGGKKPGTAVREEEAKETTLRKPAPMVGASMVDQLKDK